MNKNTIGILFLFLSLLFISCEKSNFENVVSYDDILVVNNDLGSLSERMRMAKVDINLPVVPLHENFNELKGENILALNVIAEVDPPSYEGNLLQASHVQVKGNYAYVVYNTQGSDILGGIDIIDISNPETPTLISEAIFPDHDISSLDINPTGTGNHTHVYVAGAAEIENEEDIICQAIIEKFELNSENQFKHSNSPRQYYTAPSYVATDVRLAKNSIYFTSGDGGGITKLNLGLNLKNYSDLYDARSVDITEKGVVSLKGQPGELVLYDNSLVVQSRVTVGGANIPESKSIVRISDNYAFLSLGTDGMQVYDLNTLEMIDRLDVEVPENAEYPENYVTNGVALNDNLVLVANGGAGLYVTTFNGSNFGSVGVVSFGEGTSANYIDCQRMGTSKCHRTGLIFVATGKGGLKIVEIIK